MAVCKRGGVKLNARIFYNKRLCETYRELEYIIELLKLLKEETDE